MKRLISSFKNALNGIGYVWKNEANFRLHCAIAILVLALGMYLCLSVLKFILIILCIVIILSLEIINSAIEYTWNHLEPNHHPVVGTIKDVMAGAVFLASLGIAIIGILVFIY